MNQKIFTFWEPKDKVPGYVQLCMQTWKKFLPETEVVICDYESIREYLSEQEFREVDFRKMSLAKQSDAIRCALLKKHGGIWMDADTIITSPAAMQNLQQGECCMINNGEKHNLYGAYIYTAKAECEFINQWHEQLVPRITAYKKAWKFRHFRFLFHRAWKKMKSWDYCVNAIINPIARRMSAPQLVELNSEELRVTPERCDNQQGKSPIDSYIHYWFTNRPFAADEQPGIIFLHNSWTPKHYRDMEASTFIDQDIPLAKLLKHLLS